MREQEGNSTMKVNFDLEGRENPKCTSVADYKAKVKTKSGGSAAASGRAGGSREEVSMGRRGCWKCGPFGKTGAAQEAVEGEAERSDGFSGWRQHKSFQCPNTGAARKGKQMCPRELSEEEAARIFRKASLVVGLHPDQVKDTHTHTHTPLPGVTWCSSDRLLCFAFLGAGDG